MQNLATFLYKALWKLMTYIGMIMCHFFTWFVLYCNNIKFKTFHTRGIPFIKVARGGTCTIGSNFKMNNNIQSNPIGRVQRCMLIVKKGAILTIGSNVGISATAIVVHQDINIGNNVKIGGGVCIYDTDFHSIDPRIRNNHSLDIKAKKNLPVIIKDNVFVGAHSTLLKGVIIGQNSVIGACSVVTKDIPENEIWAGNPARFIKKLEFND